eukprot:414455-Pleurochrysis_carterae.AAC.1
MVYSDRRRARPGGVPGPWAVCVTPARRCPSPTRARVQRPCALALFKHALVAVLNVKTAHRDYPKDQLLAEVGEIKDNSAEARAARQQRSGKQITFVRELQ